MAILSKSALVIPKARLSNSFIKFAQVTSHLLPSKSIYQIRPLSSTCNNNLPFNRLPIEDVRVSLFCGIPLKSLLVMPRANFWNSGKALAKVTSCFWASSGFTYQIRPRSSVWRSNLPFKRLDNFLSILLIALLWSKFVGFVSSFIVSIFIQDVLIVFHS